eukprot:g16166.t1
MPADPSPATVHPLPAHQAPAVTADYSPVTDRALAVPGDGSQATDHTPPADRAPAVSSDHSTAADRTPVHAAESSPAAGQRSPSLSYLRPRPAAPDAVSMADTVSLQVDSVSMYGTVESLLQEDGSSLGSDSELNGNTTSSPRTDRYGFLGGTQYSSG